MAKDLLKDLLKEYEQKRIVAEQKAEEKKAQLLKNYPELEKIEEEIHSYAIESAKTALSSGSAINLKEFSNHLDELKHKKQLLLQKLNISEKEIEPQYECNKCMDTGYENHNGHMVMCNCLKQKLFDSLYNASNMGDLDKENFEHFDFSKYSDKIDKEKYNSTISPRENMKLIQRISLDFVKNFEKKEEKDLLFTGNTGLGKTFLSNCIAKEVLKQGHTVLYQTAHTLLDTIIDNRFNKKYGQDDFYENVLDVDLLIIDDLGTEAINNIKLTELFNILNTRILNKNKKISKTIISTNLSLRDLFSTYDERIVSRLVGYYNICRFFGEDIRF